MTSDSDRPDQQTTSFSPPPGEGRAPWAADPQWAGQTPERWFEPMPPASRPARGRAPVSVALVLVMALLGGLVGSGATFLALDWSGRLHPAVSPAAAAQTSSPAPTARATTAVDDSVVIRVAEAVSGAVVTITVAQAADPTDPFSLPATGVGSGVIFDSAGWILTNRHVVQGATEVRVELQDGRRNIRGTVYGEDTLTDLAIVRIEEPDLVVARIGNSSELKPGQLAVAIGSPLGELTNSVTAGVISALGRQVPVTDPVTGARKVLRNLIQTDAAINQGNSGGALVDGSGTVIGINTAVAGDAQGIGFAIPINIAKPLMDQALAGEELARPWMGIVYQVVDRNLAQELDLPIDYGALISEPDATGPSVIPGSPAEEAGLRPGDILTAIDGRRIDAGHGLDDILSQYRPSDRLTLTVLRAGQTLQLEITLGTRPAGLD